MNTPSSGKRILFSCILLVFGLALIEGGARAAYRLIKGRPFPRAKYRIEMRTLAGPPDVEARPGAAPLAGDVQEGRGITVVHPYLGYVRDPDKNRHTTSHGFPGTGEAVLEESGDELIVGIFGGSFAEGVYWQGVPALSEALQSTGKRVRVVNFAMGGYKQPQQVLCLVYMLALGARFDVVVNIDGFNEVALPPVDNTPRGVAPIYPRAWHLRMAGFKDPEMLTALAELVALDRRRRNWAATFVKWRLHGSVALCQFWRAKDLRMAAARTRMAAALGEREHAAMAGYLATGPGPHEFADDEALYEYLVGVWAKCSAQMHAVCLAHGIRYLHFLQPNQYVEGAKPMGREERAVAIKDDHKYKPGVLKGYPLLREGGRELIGHGVNFTDLTMIFEGLEEPLYRDDCCHVNEQGYLLVGAAVGNRIMSELATAP